AGWDERNGPVRKAVHKRGEVFEFRNLSCRSAGVGCTNRSRRDTVLVDQTTEPITPLNSSCSCAGRFAWRPNRIGRRELQRSVWAVTIVMISKPAQHPFEMVCVEDQQPIETF